MKIFKSHFWYNKSQRNGIFILVILIVIFQIIIYNYNNYSFKTPKEETHKTWAIRQQIDSLKEVALENRKPKIFPFNPNYITDYKGEQLGMSLEEIDRLLAFRKNEKFINSTKEFQQVTHISDSLLNKISPYFKFPDWVVQRNSTSREVISNSKGFKNSYKKKEVSTTDINKATAKDFQTISGIGPAFSKKIIQYRSKLQGFSIESQLYEVYKIDKKVADKVLDVFKIINKPIIKKINVNTVTFKELLKNPYIDYELCKKIFNYRDEVAELQNISELKNIKDFPLDKYDRIVLYLVAE